MSKYISKDDVLNLPQSIERNFKGEIVERSIDVEYIESLPPADVAPVVRCKDCHCHGTCTHEQYLGLDGFCSHGERREE